MNDAATVGLALVIPTHNRSAYISETLEHALRQSVAFSEIIVVDDGSTDRTPEILSSFGSRIKTIRQENLGVQVARNAGAALATSPYVTFCDDDDLLGEDYVKLMQGHLVRHTDVDAVYCNFLLLQEDGSTSNKFNYAPKGYFDEAVVEGHFIVSFPHLIRQTVRFQPLFPTGMTVRKSFYQQIGGFDPKYNRVASEDWEFTLRAIDRGVVHICTLPLNKVRKHASNNSGNPIRQGGGEAIILEDALRGIPSLKAYQPEVLSSIDARRKSSFDAAYALGNFDKCKEMDQLLINTDFGGVFRLKKFIVQMPSPLRDWFWKLTQTAGLKNKSR